MTITIADLANRQDFLPGLIQRAPVADGAHYSVRKSTDGVVVLADTLMSAQVTDGVINVENVSTISLWVKPHFGTVPLTGVSVVPEFSGTAASDGWFPLGVVSASSIVGGFSVVELNPVRFNMDVDDQLYVWSFANPGASRMRLNSGATSGGTNTASNLTVDVSFGWGIPTVSTVI